MFAVALVVFGVFLFQLIERHFKMKNHLFKPRMRFVH